MSTASHWAYSQHLLVGLMWPVTLNPSFCAESVGCRKVHATDLLVCMVHYTTHICLIRHKAHLVAVMLHPAAAAVLSPCSALQGQTAGLQWAAATVLTAVPAQHSTMSAV
jgi:hypothetical protein